MRKPLSTKVLDGVVLGLGMLGVDGTAGYECAVSPTLDDNASRGEEDSFVYPLLVKSEDEDP